MKLPLIEKFAPIAISSFLLFAGCSGDEPPAIPEETLTDEVDMTSFDRGSRATNAVLHSLAASDAMFAFDPTLDPALSAEANAQAVRAHIEETLDSCASAVVSGSSVTVTFEDGCVLRTGLTASGSMTVAITKTGSTLEAAVTFNALMVGEGAVNGTAVFTTSNGSTFAVDAAITSSAGAIDADLTVVGTPTAMEIDGSATVTRDGKTAALAFARVVWGLGDCYPSSGTMTMGVGRGAQTVTFNGSTPTTGAVTITKGRATLQATLPPYGACPPGA